jgi:3-oxoacyl-[acyl-carrier-protein] synthase-3
MRVFQPAEHGVGVALAATAAYLPARRVDNAELAALGCPLSPAEIERAAGILERRHAAPDEAASDLAAAAGRAALRCAGRAATALDRVIVSTTSPDHLMPSTACAAAQRLGVIQAPAFDLAASCAGFAFALDAAARAVATGEGAVLAVAAEVRSRFVDVRDRATGALFGDGAAAALLERGEPGAGIVAIGVTCAPAAEPSLLIPAGGSREPTSAATVAANRHVIEMRDGVRLYVEACEGIARVGNELLAAIGLSLADVDLVVPHQPNRRMIRRLGQLLRLGPERLFCNVERVGNTSSAACGIALDAALRGGRVRPGGRVLLVTGGAGYTAAAALIVPDAALLRRLEEGDDQIPR